jgi:hypothetical protein
MKMKEFVFHFEFFLYVCFYYKQYLMIVLCLNFLFFRFPKFYVGLVYVWISSLIMISSNILVSEDYNLAPLV